MITSQIYLSDKHALAYYSEKATAGFWDKHWSVVDLRSVLRNATDDRLFVPLVKKYLSRESVVLEGGCGTGHIVHALQYQGYKAIGIDFAEETIQKVKEAVPEMDVRVGNVFSLDLSDGELDGYVSVGVVEHFWDGYGPIFNEMRRTLKVGGYLFISFPYMSPLRRIKVMLRKYPVQESAGLNYRQDQFYQFALDSGRVQSDLEALGFQLQEQLTYDGIKGFKDEVAIFKSFLQEIYDGKRVPRLRYYLDRLLKPFASHVTLLVLQKIR